MKNKREFERERGRRFGGGGGESFSTDLYRRIGFINMEVRGRRR